MDKSKLKYLDEVINKKIEIFTNNFPDNSIYVGYCTYGLDENYRLHKKCRCSPIFKILNKYPDVKPKLEVKVKNKTYKDIYNIQRQILDLNPNKKILNVNLWLYGY